MVGASYYRTEAERCRKRAAEDPASESAARWIQLAAEYEQLADALQAQDEDAPAVQRLPMQQQSMQQQQSKAEDEDET